ncbi:hypothetical protein [Mobilicoccus massiliensis]|uniref:hypothetical protein n=1 Tax=Mobilicoccus massiliensis TaxID=1522310 RepID=UPI000AE0766F|nr:hypothetical protein [Mobilicoccus massiliensis]
MTTAETLLSPPSGSGGGDGWRALPDADVLDEHRLRRARLSAALCRGSAPTRRAAAWTPAVAGVVLTLVALGGTAVGATVHRHLPRTAFSTPAAGAGGASIEADTATSAAGDRNDDGRDADARGERTTDEEVARPYGPWLRQTISHTAR